MPDGLATAAYPTRILIEILEEFHNHLMALPLQFATGILIENLEEFRSQSHYIEVAQGDIFMEQKMRFRLFLGQLAVRVQLCFCTEKC